jgi:hypothetical protein
MTVLAKGTIQCSTELAKGTAPASVGEEGS